MDKVQTYIARVNLLLKVLPTIIEPKVFGLSGGTLLNLFYLNMPRYSIDIDLVWFPNDELEVLKEKARKVFEEIFVQLNKENITTVFYPKELHFDVKEKIKLPKKNRPHLGFPTNLKINVQISYYKREFLQKPTTVRLSPNARKKFGCDFEVVGLGKEEIFANKLYVACSRQAPKDIFDAFFIKKELDLDDISDVLREALIYNIVSYDRGEPSMEFGLNPMIKDNKITFDQDFVGINIEPFSYQDYLIEQKQNILDVHNLLTDRDKEFIFSIQKTEPRWDIYDFRDSFAVKARINNLEKFKKEDYRRYKRDTKNVFNALNNTPKLRPKIYNTRT